MPKLALVQGEQDERRAIIRKYVEDDNILLKQKDEIHRLNRDNKKLASLVEKTEIECRSAIKSIDLERKKIRADYIALKKEYIKLKKRVDDSAKEAEKSHAKMLELVSGSILRYIELVKEERLTDDEFIFLSSSLNGKSFFAAEIENKHGKILYPDSKLTSSENAGYFGSFKRLKKKRFFITEKGKIRYNQIMDFIYKKEEEKTENEI